MSSYIYQVFPKSVNLKQLSNPEKIEVRQAKFFCRVSDFSESDGEKINKKYHKKDKAEYIVLTDDMTDLYGETVYAYNSEDGFFNDDHDLSVKFMPVGVIMGKKRAWYIEKRKDVVEKINRQHIFRNMKNKKQSIGQFGYDFNKYEEWLYQQDKIAKANGEDIFFQGWQIKQD